MSQARAFPYTSKMMTISVTKARARLARLLKETAESHQPIQITGKQSMRFLCPKRIGRGIEETFICWPFRCANQFEGLAVPLNKTYRNRAGGSASVLLPNTRRGCEENRRIQCIQ